jgi:chromosomal replication initiator protein
MLNLPPEGAVHRRRRVGGSLLLADVSDKRGCAFMSDATLWESVLKKIKGSIRRQQFETWFRCAEAVEARPGKLRLAVPNRFYKDWLEKYYLEVIEDALFSVTGARGEIEFLVEPGVRPSAVETEQVDQSGAETAAEAPAEPIASGVTFSPDYTFDSFVVGPANRLSHAAALAVVEAPGRAYNPLFIHGGVGLGKTHLLQAASRSFIARNPGATLVYISCEEFVNRFVYAVQRGDMESFRAHLRDVSFLVIDDIHFLARAERTQEEFFHTFNSLYNAHKQIVLSSDSPPSEIPSLEERLVSRFKWGLVARIDPPTYETRLAIVKNKAAQRGHELPAGVGEFIAHSVNTNIRELEGALTRVMGYAALTNKPITLELAQEALQELLISRVAVSIEEIAREVASRYNVKLADLQGKRRTKSIALPRQICMHIARRLTDYSLEEIGGFFGGRDHTTVMYADEKIGQLVQTDAAVRGAVSEIEATLSR